MRNRDSLLQQIDELQRALNALRLAILEDDETPPVGPNDRYRRQSNNQHAQQVVPDEGHEERDFEVGDLVRILNPNLLLGQANTGTIVQVKPAPGFVFYKENGPLRRRLRRKRRFLERLPNRPN
ncbi:MAG: hypothetical protein VX057_04135 [Candidatus Thermoplasmatota archaeon]|nr:hypothetical protein [Candidatus Thermoplasmatota archaeon]